MNSARRRLPETGRGTQAILADMDRGRKLDWEWHSPKNLTASYYGGPEVTRIALEAFIKHIGDNVVHQSGLHPSVRRYEQDMTDMALSLFHAPDGAAGTITTGGSESIALALKTARDRAYEMKGIAAPEIVIPQSAYAVFNKLSHLLGIKVVQMTDSPGYRADAAAMAKAVTSNTIMLVGSAPPFPLCNVDPVSEIAALARQSGIWCHVDACIGGFMLPFAEMLGEGVPSFDFRVPGVTSISADFHKYGYACRGCSILCLRDGELLNWQSFSTNSWNAGDYFSMNVAGSRNSGPIASAWAVFDFLGAEGFKEVTAGILKGRRAFIEGINSIDGLEILGAPEGPHFAFRAHDMNILSLANGLMSRGWAINVGTKPASILLMLSSHHHQSAEPFLRDLRELTGRCRQGDSEAVSNGGVFGIY